MRPAALAVRIDGAEEDDGQQAAADERRRQVQVPTHRPAGEAQDYG